MFYNKYQCKVAGNRLEVSLPIDATPLYFRNQSGSIFCYATSHKIPLAPVDFLFVRTGTKGVEIPDNAQPLGQVQTDGVYTVFKI